MRYHWFFVRVLLLSALVGTNARDPLRADDIAVPALTADESAALESIQEGRVVATVDFLASDEMAGRNTPSPELNIAAAYVAARFRGAGLEGLGPEGSFYQTSEYSQVIPAREGLRIVVNGTSLEGAALLMGTGGEVSVKGSITNAEGAGNQAFSGPIVVGDVILPPQAASNPLSVLAMWSRRVRPWANQGATAVFVRAEADSPLTAVCESLRSQPVALPPQFAFAVPVIVVDPSVSLEGPAELTIPANREVLIPVRNVIGLLRGSDPELSKQAIVITAHLDHIGRQMSGPDPVNNGADDNATGVTGVVMLADAFGALKERPKRSVICMTFWGEEKGLLGSKYFVRNPLWPLEQITANINLEMIGRPEEGAEGRVWGTGWPHSNLGPLMAVGAARAGVTVFHHEQFSEMLYTRSDNDSFVRAGVIAHSFSAGSLHGDYHQPSDEVAKLKTAHMTKVIRGLFAGALPIAQGLLTPVKSDK